MGLQQPRRREQRCRRHAIHPAPAEVDGRVDWGLGPMPEVAKATEGAAAVVEAGARQRHQRAAARRAAQREDARHLHGRRVVEVVLDAITSATQLIDLAIERQLERDHRGSRPRRSVAQRQIAHVVLIARGADRRRHGDGAEQTGRPPPPALCRGAPAARRRR